MAKEKKFNPVAAERKAQKAKEIKKGKADLQARRNEKLAQRNPNRLKEQIATLKAIVESGGKLTALEEQSLESLERDLKAVEKARKALGDRAPTFGRGGGDGRGGGTFGKRKRNEDEPSSDDDSDVPEDVRRIPMPRDTPPPIPRPVLDEWWAKRRAKRSRQQEERGGERGGGGGGANALPLGKDRGIGGGGGRDEKSTTPTPATAVAPQVVYEAKPIVRDLRKEAVSAFVPTAVRMKMQKTKGVGGLMEPEEADRLEREGYLKTTPAGGSEVGASTTDAQRRTVTMEEVDDDED